MCIKKIKQAAEHEGGSLTSTEYTKWNKEHSDGKMSMATIVKVFGSWKQAMKEAEIPPKVQVGVVKIGLPSSFKTKEDCVLALQTAAKTLGEKFSRKSYIKWQQENKEHPVFETIKKRFDSWESAKKEAGLSMSDRFQMKKSAEECINGLKKASEELGRSFTIFQYEQWRRSHEGYPCIAVLQKSFGSWTKALKAASLEPLSGVPYSKNGKSSKEEKVS